MKDKKNIVIGVLVLACIVLLVLVFTGKKADNCDAKDNKANTTSSTTVASGEIKYDCEKEFNENDVKTTMRIIMVRDGEGSIKTFKTGTVSSFDNDDSYNAMINWSKENNSSYEELGEHKLYLYSDLSSEYTNVWFKNILDFYIQDGYKCSNN